MWLCLNDAFFSIVADRHDPDRLLVRARQIGDIERYFPHADVEVGAGNDYLFRASVDRQAVAAIVAQAVTAIHYDNFKNSVRDGARRHAYAECWKIMYQFQENNLDNKFGRVETS